MRIEPFKMTHKINTMAEIRKKTDPLILVFKRALDLGEFISYNRSWEFVRSLEDVKHKIDALVKDGQAERAVSLYEIFLSGCYEKADEIDDSGGNLGMFFEDLFCAWINARQKAKYKPEETVQNILKWITNIYLRHSPILSFQSKGGQYAGTRMEPRSIT